MQTNVRRNQSLITVAAWLIGSTTLFADQTKKGSDIQFYGFLLICGPSSILQILSIRKDIR